MARNEAVADFQGLTRLANEQEAIDGLCSSGVSCYENGKERDNERGLVGGCVLAWGAKGYCFNIQGRVCMIGVEIKAECKRLVVNV